MRAAVAHYLLFWSVTLVGAAFARAATSEITVATDDTSITVKVIGDRPAITSLMSRPGSVDWVGGNSGAIPLIDAAEVRGRKTPVQWRFAGSDKGTLKFVCDQQPLEV
jgi:hypothetical protein